MKPKFYNFRMPCLLRRFVATTIVLLYFGLPGFSQVITLSGTVRDGASKALEGVSVIALPSKQGTLTNEEGKFEMTVDSSTHTLQFSYIGFQSYDWRVDTTGYIDIVLEEQGFDLEKVVVVGYGAQKESNITNAVATLDFENLENLPQSSTLNLLSGRVAGLSAIQTSGRPGDDGTELKLRGVGNTGFANPLIVIDGIMSSPADLSRLQPSEIANVSVLKDASSAAIYGSRGANGVILVTTKTPEAGKFRINLNSYFGLQEGTYLPQFVESWQWMTLQNEAANTQLFPEEAISAVRNGIHTDTFANYNPVPDVFRTAPMSSTTISLSGGTKNISFQGTFGYLDQEGIMLGTRSNRYNYRSNIKATISDKLESGLNISGYLQRVHQSAARSGGVMMSLLRSYPITPKKYSNGEWGVYNGYTGTSSLPALLSADIGRWDEDNSRLNIQPYLQYQPIKGLLLKSTFAYTNAIRRREVFRPTYTFYAPSGDPALSNRINSISNWNLEGNQIQMTNLASYNLRLQENDFTLLGGYEIMSYKRLTTSLGGSNLPSNDKQVVNQATTDINASGSRQRWAYESLFGRLNYAYKDRYFLEANMRRDGSSRLPPDKRYTVFPAFSGGWMISREPFFSNLRLDGVIDQFKIRAGWGKSGNDLVGNRNYYQTLKLTNYYYFGGDLYPGASVNAFSNENLRWVLSTTSNLGVDLKLLKNRLSITYDLYRKELDGIIFFVNLPPSFGHDDRFTMNRVDALNKGWELSMGYKSSGRKVSVDVNLNLAYNQNEVLEVEGGNPEWIQGQFLFRKGEAFHSFYGLEYDGIIRDSVELANAPVLTTRNLEIGSMKFKDINGDNVINEEDRTVLGTGNVPFEYGFSAGISFKNLDFRFLVQGVRGKYIYVRDWANLPGTAELTNFWKEWWDNRYDAENNPQGTWPVMRRGAPGANEVSSFWIHNASYLRLKNVEVGYTLPAELLRKIGVENVRFYVVGQNLFTISPLIKQLDPERFTRQVNNRVYPQVRIVTAGINIGI